jgi:hypothetical protein
MLTCQILHMSLYVDDDTSTLRQFVHDDCAWPVDTIRDTSVLCSFQRLLSSNTTTMALCFTARANNIVIFQNIASVGSMAKQVSCQHASRKDPATSFRDGEPWGQPSFCLRPGANAGTVHDPFLLSTEEYGYECRDSLRRTKYCRRWLRNTEYATTL